MAARFTTVQITADEQKFFACPLAARRPQEAIKDWQRHKGESLRIELPPTKRPTTCTGWCWRVSQEETNRIRGWQVHSWVCEHEIDAD
jgi:hypothetical protein